MIDPIDRDKTLETITYTISKYIPMLEGDAIEIPLDIARVIMNMPSAQSEIIRCKDCRWWDKSEDSPFGYCMAMKHGYMSANWEIGIYRRYKGDWYCADAERRTDE